MDITKFTSKDVDKIFDAVNKYSVGLDDVFHRLHSYGMTQPGGQYPPYNIVKESNVKWRIELHLLVGRRTTLKSHWRQTSS